MSLAKRGWQNNYRDDDRHATSMIQCWVYDRPSMLYKLTIKLNALSFIVFNEGEGNK